MTERVTPAVAAARLANEAMCAALTTGAGDPYAHALELLAAAARRVGDHASRAASARPRWRGWTL